MDTFILTWIHTYMHTQTHTYIHTNGRRGAVCLISDAGFVAAAQVLSAKHACSSGSVFCSIMDILGTCNHTLRRYIHPRTVFHSILYSIRDMQDSFTLYYTLLGTSTNSLSLIFILYSIRDIQERSSTLCYTLLGTRKILSLYIILY